MLFTFQNVYKAYKACRKQKTNTFNVLKFEQNLLENLWDLTHDLQNRTYKIGQSICFLTHSPKLKLLPAHKTLFLLPKYKGLAIGNLRSQFFGNVYMNAFDKSKKRLEGLLPQIRTYLKENLALTLREDVKLKPHSSGLDFLGYIIREDYLLTRQRVVNNYKAKKAVYLNHYEAKKGKMSREEIKEFLSVQASFVSHIQHANSFNLMNKVGQIDESNPFDYDRT